MWVWEVVADLFWQVRVRQSSTDNRQSTMHAIFSGREVSRAFRVPCALASFAGASRRVILQAAVAADRPPVYERKEPHGSALR